MVKVRVFKHTSPLALPTSETDLSSLVINYVVSKRCTDSIVKTIEVFLEVGIERSWV